MGRTRNFVKTQPLKKPSMNEQFEEAFTLFSLSFSLRDAADLPQHS